MKSGGRIFAIGSLLAGIAFFAYLDYRWSQIGHNSNLYETMGKAGGLFSTSDGKTSAEAGDKHSAKKIAHAHQYFKLRNRIADVERKIMTLRDDINKLEERSDSEFENGAITDASKRGTKEDAKIEYARHNSMEAPKDISLIPDADDGLVKKFPVFPPAENSEPAKPRSTSKSMAGELSKKLERFLKGKDTAILSSPSKSGIEKNGLDEDSVPAHRKNFPILPVDTDEQVMAGTFIEPQISSRHKVTKIMVKPKENTSGAITAGEGPIDRAEKSNEELIKEHEDMHKISDILFGSESDRKTTGLSNSGETYGIDPHHLGEDTSAHHHGKDTPAVPKSLNIADGKDKEEKAAPSRKVDEVFNDPFMFSDMGETQPNKMSNDDIYGVKSPANVTKVYCESYADPAEAFRLGKCIFKAKANYQFAKSMGFLASDASNKSHSAPVDPEEDSELNVSHLPRDSAYSKKLGGVIRIEKEDVKKATPFGETERPYVEEHEMVAKPTSIEVHILSKKSSETLSSPGETTSSDKTAPKGITNTEDYHRTAKKDEALDFNPAKGINKESENHAKAEDVGDGFMDISSVLNKYAVPGFDIGSYVPKITDFISGGFETPASSSEDYPHGSRQPEMSEGHPAPGITENIAREKEPLDNRVSSKSFPEKITAVNRDLDLAKSVVRAEARPILFGSHNSLPHERFNREKMGNIDTESSSISDYSSTSSNFSPSAINKHPEETVIQKPIPKPLSIGVVITTTKSNLKSGLVDEKSEKASASSSEKKKGMSKEKKSSKS